MAEQIYISKQAALSLLDCFKKFKTSRNISSSDEGTVIRNHVVNAFGIPIVASYNRNELLTYSTMFTYNGRKFELLINEDNYLCLKVDGYYASLILNSDTSYRYGIYILTDSKDIVRIECYNTDSNGLKDISLDCYGTSEEDITKYTNNYLNCRVDTNINIQEIESDINNNEYCYLKDTVKNILNYFISSKDIKYFLEYSNERNDIPENEKLNVPIERMDKNNKDLVLLTRRTLY